MPLAVQQLYCRVNAPTIYGEPFGLSPGKLANPAAGNAPHQGLFTPRGWQPALPQNVHTGNEP